MIELSKQHLAIMMEAGYVYLGMRRFKESRAVFEGIAAIAPGSEIPQVAVGNVDFCEGKIAQAIRRYTKALAIDPASVFAKVYLGEALYFSGKVDEATDLLKGVAKGDRGGAGEFAQVLLDAIISGAVAPAAGAHRSGKGKKSS